MTEFYHPYQFVPVTGKINGKPSARLPYADIAAGKPDVVTRHDLWQQDTLSGRLICSVTLKTPTFIGQQRTKDASDHHPAEVDGYKRLVDGKEVYILPGSSLRGIVGAVAEALSQSAMRVLEDSRFKARVRREKVDLASSTWDFFRQAYGEDCLPWNPYDEKQRKGRLRLTPAEALWGVVEDEKAGDAIASRNLASRLRFSDALPVVVQPAERQLLPFVTLKILASPKPPCPAMYFHQQRGGLIRKEQLRAKDHLPNGRKVYLHHPQDTQGKEFWKTRQEFRDKKQKVRIRPLRDGLVFQFHVDFENISSEELGLLYTSLNPSPTFQHRLGMGKSYGLGSVRLNVDGLFLINRLQRYSQDCLLDNGRYHDGFIRAEAKAGDWLGLYAIEKQAASNAQPLEQYTFQKSLVDSDSLKNTLAAGNPDNLKAGVRVDYPRRENQPPEKEGFKWFVENNKPARDQQVLGTIRNGIIPKLETN